MEKKDKVEWHATGAPECTIGEMDDWYRDDAYAWPISGDATTWLVGHWRKESE